MLNFGSGFILQMLIQITDFEYPRSQGANFLLLQNSIKFGDQKLPQPGISGSGYRNDNKDEYSLLHRLYCARLSRGSERNKVGVRN